MENNKKMLDTTSLPAASRLAACGPSETVLDLEVLMSLPGVSLRRDAPVLKRLLGIFVVEMNRNIGLLQGAYAEGDRAQIGRLTHRMKSSALAMGASCLGGLALRLDGNIKAGVPLDAAEGGAIAAAWGDVRQALLDEGLLSPDELCSIEASIGS